VNDDAIWRNRFRSDSGILEAVPAQDENGFGSHVEKVPEIYLVRFSEQKGSQLGSEVNESE
jgi:hypothetical protein